MELHAGELRRTVFETENLQRHASIPTPPRPLQSKGDCSALDAELRACMARSRLQ
jgi:hypothetical protein